MQALRCRSPIPKGKNVVGPTRRCSARSELRQAPAPPARPRRQPPAQLCSSSNALHRIAITQARLHPPARGYLERKQAEGKSRREAIRCLKRQLARTIFAWLWSIVLNKARTAQRSTRQRRRLEQLAQAEEPVDSPNDLAQESLRTRVAALPERQRQVVFLRYYVDMDYRAIAEALCVATGTVSATLSAAHAVLRVDEPTEVSL